MGIYIAFGANQGDPLHTFKSAVARLSERGVECLSMSGAWQSPAWPKGSGQDEYINACAEVRFGGTPVDLLRILHSIEASLGRVRGEKNAPRTLDLDVLDFNQQIITSDAITIPHPRMMDRGFVLLPLFQIAPHWKNPRSGESLDKAIAKLPLADIAPVNYLGRIEL